jgi:hypothetical protein
MNQDSVDRRRVEGIIRECDLSSLLMFLWQAVSFSHFLSP